MLDPSDEVRLTEAVARGDRAAFTTLARAWVPGLRRYARGLVGADAAADDVVQESLLAFWRGAAQLHPGHSGRPWLYAVTRRQAARSFRRAAEAPTESMEELARAAGWGSDPEALAARVEDVERIHAALDELSPADREIVLLRDVEGLSGPEVAGILDLPEATMKTRLHRARLRLLAALGAGGSHG